jgi:hypothetical protein
MSESRPSGDPGVPEIDERQHDAPDADRPTLDPAAKTQPAEGGRDEVDDGADDAEAQRSTG